LETGIIVYGKILAYVFNPLSAELNPICHLLVLLGAHPILHISRIRVYGYFLKIINNLNINNIVQTMAIKLVKIILALQNH
jgi:hypothetical protein